VEVEHHAIVGGMTPVLVVLLNAVWGISAAYWLSMLGEE